MKRSILISSAAVSLCIGVAAPLLAAEPPVSYSVNHSSPSKKNASITKPAEKCLSDLSAFNSRMEKDGYWLGGSGGGFGYPMDGLGYVGYGYTHPTGGAATGYPAGGYPAGTSTGYHDVRSGYEVRSLLASANILARNGQQRQCEDMLATTRTVYNSYLADLHSRGVPMADVPSWRNQAIAAAQPVTSETTSFRSDELLDAPVRSRQDVALGSVDDIVISPQTGKIAYLVIARGGILGIGESYVPVPWEDFKIMPNVSLLVLDTTKSDLDAAPRVNKDQFSPSGHFDQQSQKVDAYWKAHLSSKGSAGSNG
jgi:sporulation protein YlmC with PRC-barrel domain